MSTSCDRCDGETCALLAVIADADYRITPERIETRLRQALAHEAGDVPDVRKVYQIHWPGAMTRRLPLCMT